MNRTAINPSGQERWLLETGSPIGLLRIVAHTTAIVGLYHVDHSPAPTAAALGRPAVETDILAAVHPDRLECIPVGAPDATALLLHQATAQLAEYFAGLRRAFDLPVELLGTTFQRTVWGALIEIPHGERRSYRDLAEHLGNPSMGRAIGAAVRANPVSVIVPGHRVVSSTGAVVGYAAGTGIKTALLDGESAGHFSVVNAQKGREDAGSETRQAHSPEHAKGDQLVTKAPHEAPWQHGMPR